MPSQLPAIVQEKAFKSGERSEGAGSGGLTSFNKATAVEGLIVRKEIKINKKFYTFADF